MKLSYQDKYHSYWLDGRRCKSVTTVAKIPDDTYSLDQWRKRQVAIGMAMSPPLVERVAAHFDERDKVDQAAEEAMVVAKAHEAAGRGTAAHRITERLDLGEDLIDTPLSRAVRQAWTEALEEAHLVIDPEYVERIVVYPDLYIAGRIDRFVRNYETGRLHGLDLKTGSNAIKYPHSMTIQVALYVNAPLLAGPIPNGGGETHDFTPLPADLDKDVGYVVHMPEDGRVEVVEIDIAAGWQAVQQICFPTLTWRARKNLARQTISAATWAPELRLVTEDGTLEPQPSAPAARVPSTTPAAEFMARFRWVEARCQKLVDDGYGRTLMFHWPTGVPYFRDGGPRNDPEVELLVGACDATEADHKIPFGATDPTQPTTTKTTQARSNRNEQPVS